MTGRPRRAVVGSMLRSYSPIFMDGVRYCGWDLKLACGHETQRRPRYRSGTVRRGFGFLYHPPKRTDVLPPQSIAYCADCARTDG